MSLDFDEDVWMFISLAQKHNVEMLMVGGGAVNFYGYQRHSADVDFWIDTTPSNLVALREALNELGYEFDDFPEDVKRGQQNISIKISPVIDIELITSFQKFLRMLRAKTHGNKHDKRSNLLLRGNRI